MSSRKILLSVPEDKRLSFNSARSESESELDLPDLSEYKMQTNGDVLKAEVVALVREVLPDEIGNVGDMLEEFRGREEELLQSLQRIRAKSKAQTTHGGMDPDDFIPEEGDRGGKADAWTSDPGGGAAGDFDVDQWQRDLDGQLDGSNRSLSMSNPQGETSMLKSPPELMNGATHSHMEEKKNDSWPEHSLLHVDPDENDVPPSEDLQQFPQTVRANSMKNLMMSNLTTESSLDGTVDTSSTNATPPPPMGGGATSAGRRSVALVKLRVWDPARPRGRLKCLAATRIVLAGPEEAEEMSASHARAVALRRDGGGGEDKLSLSERRRRLSIVKEEPEKPPHRGDSYFDSGNDNSDESILRRRATDGTGSTKSSMRPEEEVQPDDEVLWGELRQRLHVGARVGVQLSAPSPSPAATRQQPSGGISMASSVASSVASGYAGKQTYEWKVGNAIAVHKLDFLATNDLSRLCRRLRDGHPSLRELVLDGLPPNAITLEGAEAIFDALGSNASVRRLSLRRSHVGDDAASLLALSLVDNSTLTQLHLEGNALTNVSAKNFYSVLKKNNGTLRVLDLSDNPDIDDDVLQALDQFMEQRALKRTLTNKAEKAKRAARGMPPDAALDDDEEETLGGVTVVVAREAAEGDLDGSGRSSENRRRLQQMSSSLSTTPSVDASVANKPKTGESFRDYMRRMDEMKENKNRSSSHLQKLGEESVRERESFESYTPLTDYSQHSYQFLKGLEEEPEEKREEGEPSVDASRQSPDDHVSTGSSITTRETNRRENSGRDVITTNSDEATKQSLAGSRDGTPSNAHSVKWADKEHRAPPGRRDSMETQESLEENRRNSMMTEESYQRTNSGILTEASEIDIPRLSDLGVSDLTDLGRSCTTLATEASGTMGPGAHPYHPTQTSRGSTNPSINLSEEDYVDPKANEREMRRRLAESSMSATPGAFQIDEAAPSRQNRGGGPGPPGGAGGRRPRVRRTASQRRARLAELEEGGGGGVAASSAGRASSGPQSSAAEDAAEMEFLDADVDLTDLERADALFRSHRIERRKSHMSAIGLDEPGSGVDKIVCSVIAVLVFVLLILVVVFLR